MALFYRDDIFKLDRIIQVHKNFIAARLITKSTYLSLGLTYIQPDTIHDSVLQELADCIEQIKINFSTHIIIVGGDFNGRVAELDQVATEFVPYLGNKSKK